MGLFGNIPDVLSQMDFTTDENVNLDELDTLDEAPLIGGKPGKGKTAKPVKVKPPEDVKNVPVAVPVAATTPGDEREAATVENAIVESAIVEPAPVESVTTESTSSPTPTAEVADAEAIDAQMESEPASVESVAVEPASAKPATVEVAQPITETTTPAQSELNNTLQRELAAKEEELKQAINRLTQVKSDNELLQEAINQSQVQLEQMQTVITEKEDELAKVTDELVKITERATQAESACTLYQGELNDARNALQKAENVSDVEVTVDSLSCYIAALDKLRSSSEEVTSLLQRVYQPASPGTSATTASTTPVTSAAGEADLLIAIKRSPDSLTQAVQHILACEGKDTIRTAFYIMRLNESERNELEKVLTALTVDCDLSKVTASEQDERLVEVIELATGELYTRLKELVTIENLVKGRAGLNERDIHEKKRSTRPEK